MAKNKKRNNNQKNKNNNRNNKTPYPRTKRGQIFVNVTSGLIIAFISFYLLGFLAGFGNDQYLNEMGATQRSISVIHRVWDHIASNVIAGASRVNRIIFG